MSYRILLIVLIVVLIILVAGLLFLQLQGSDVFGAIVLVRMPKETSTAIKNDNTELQEDSSTQEGILQVNDLTSNYEKYNRNTVTVMGTIYSRGGDKISIVDINEPDEIIHLNLGGVKNSEYPGYLTVGDKIKVYGSFSYKETGGGAWHKKYEYAIYSSKIEKVEQ